MATLSAKCLKEALKNPKNCMTKAQTAASEKCKNETGRGKGACLDANLADQLAKKCADIVCPGDPFAVIEAVPSTRTPASTIRADEGGGFDSGGPGGDVLYDGPDPDAPEQGADPSKVKFYLLAGIGILVVLAMVKKR